MNRHVTLFLLTIIIVKAIGVGMIPYKPGTDEAWQVQAAIRLANGDGLTSSMDDLALIALESDNDLSKSKYLLLTNWPPIYSILIAGFISLGFSSKIALSIINLLFYLLGLCGWLLVLKRFNIRPSLQICAIGLISGTMYRMTGTCMFVWSLFSYISYLILGLIEEPDNCKWGIVCLLTVVSIYTRYQMLSFIAIVPLFILIHRRDRSAIVSLFIYIIISFSSYVALKTYNAYNGFDLISSISPNLGVDIISLMKSLTIIIPSIIVGINLENVFFGNWLYVFGFFGSFVFVYLIIREKKSTGKLAVLASLALAVSVGQMMIVGSTVGWNAVLEIRYYMFFAPIMHILIAVLLDIFVKKDMKNTSSSKLVIVMMTSVILVFFANAIFDYAEKASKAKTFFKNKGKTHEMLHSIKSDGRELIVFTGMDDPHFLSSQLLYGAEFPVFRRFDILNKDEVYVSRGEMILVIVPDNVEWQSKISSKWKVDLLKTRHGYSIYHVF